MTKVAFYQLAYGSVFEFHGRRYQKIAPSMMRDEAGNGSVCQSEMEVMVEGVPVLLPPEEAERWRRNDDNWSSHLAPSPIAMGWEPGFERFDFKTVAEWEAAQANRKKKRKQG